MSGNIGILNVGAGDTKLSFDRSNPAECIRAARIVTDMLRRGYALLVKVGEDDAGQPVYQRVHEFREDTCEYIVADFDPVTAQEKDAQEQKNGESSPPAGGAKTPGPKATPRKQGRGRPRMRAISAASTSGVAVGRTAGG